MVLVGPGLPSENPSRGVGSLEGGAGGELIEIVGPRQAPRHPVVVWKVAAVLFRFGDFVKTLRELLIKLHGIVLTKTHFFSNSCHVSLQLCII